MTDDILWDLQIESWDEFDIFKVSKLTGGKPLEAVAMAVLEDFNLVSSLELNTAKLTRFIKVGWLPTGRPC